MSSNAVRSAFRAAWPTLLADIPLVETINDSPDAVEIEHPIWATLVFDVVNRAPVTMGSKPWIEETGVILVAMMSYSGIGDDDVSKAADRVVLAFDQWQSPDRAMWIQSVDAPRAPDMEAGGNVYRLSVNVNYTYQTRGV